MRIIPQAFVVGAAICALALATGCKTNSESSKKTATTPAATNVTAKATPTPTPTTTTPATAAKKTIRIRFGSSEALTDSSGNVWEGERGINGGSTVDRDAGLAVANTKDAAMFRSEHYSMDDITLSVPNGKYIAKLYFAETYDGITGPGERVFTFKVQDKEFKDFDVFVKAGGFAKVYVETVPVEVTNGTFKITFTSQVENPEINGLELIPQ
jgi:hypothetical protein